MTPFDFANGLMTSRENLMTPETRDQYVPFIINRHFSYFADLVHYANDMNLAHHLTKETQNTFYLNTLPKRKRYSKWEKKQSDLVIQAISAYFQCNEARAEEYVALLPDDVKAKILNDVGMKNVKKPGRGNAKKS